VYTTVYGRLEACIPLYTGVGGIYTTVLRLEGRHIHHCSQARRRDTRIYHPGSKEGYLHIPDLGSDL